MNFIEPLESRIAPAALSGHVLTYTDTDGDGVSIQFSKGTLDASLFTFDTAFEATGGQQLQKLNLSGLAAFKGGNIQVVVTQNGGDGFVNIGTIDATGLDLGRVIISGDLGRIDVGDSHLQTAALKELNVNSLGVAGLATQGEDQELTSNMQGGIGKVTVQESVAGDLEVNGKVSSLTVGGSLLGGAAEHSGSVQMMALGSAAIAGDLAGGVANYTGYLSVLKTAGAISIHGALQGGAGDFSGRLSVLGKASTVSVDGALAGGDGNYSGVAAPSGGAREIIVGSITGGSGESSGGILSAGGLAKVIVKGDILGGSADTTGFVGTTGRMGSVSVEGNVAGSATQPAAIFASAKIGTVKIEGDVTAADILAGVDDPAKTGFGNADDTRLDPQQRTSIIGKIIVTGVVSGTAGESDHFGFTADWVKAVTIHGTAVKLTGGAKNDSAGVEIGSTGDFTIRELPPA